MGHITTFMGEDFTPLSPNPEQIHIEDIAHALSMMCRANGHFTRFYSVAQHCINCANEAKACGLSKRVQMACLLHDASEAYLSDITRPVKKHLSRYLEIEKHLHDTIYTKLLGSPLTAEEFAHVDRIDHDMLVCEFNALMRKKVFDDCPIIKSKPVFEFTGFYDVEQEYIAIFTGQFVDTTRRKPDLTNWVKQTENTVRNKNDVIRWLEENDISIATFRDKMAVKRLSAQIDVLIHAYGMLLALPRILEDDETIEYLSLGAGNTGKPFDLVTSKRIAEFKFAEWDGRHNTIRQNNIFTNFLELAIDTDSTGKAKYIYCLSADKVIRFLSKSERSLSSVLSRVSINMHHEDIQEEYKTVNVFYHTYKDEVKIVDLSKYLDFCEK